MQTLSSPPGLDTGGGGAGGYLGEENGDCNGNALQGRRHGNDGTYLQILISVSHTVESENEYNINSIGCCNATAESKQLSAAPTH